MPTMNVRPLTKVQIAYAGLIETQKQKMMNAVQAEANLAYQTLREELGVPAGVTMDVAVIGGEHVATWKSDGPQLVADIGPAGVSESAAAP